MLFVIEALRQLLADEHFSNLLRAEGWTPCLGSWRTRLGRGPLA